MASFIEEERKEASDITSITFLISFFSIPYLISYSRLQVDRKAEKRQR